MAEFLKRWRNVPALALIVSLVGLAIVLGGSFFENAPLRDGVDSFYANAISEFIRIALTVLVLDVLYQMREGQVEKRRLILQMSSPEKSFALEAVRALRIQGWLKDGSLRKAGFRGANLRGANLRGADLQGADLIKVDLSGANLVGANLSEAALFGASLVGANLIGANLDDAYLSGANLVGAILTEEQLAQTRSLEGATLPEGKTYDGRFDLEGDLELEPRD